MTEPTTAGDTGLLNSLQKNNLFLAIVPRHETQMPTFFTLESLMVCNANSAMTLWHDSLVLNNYVHWADNGLDTGVQRIWYESQLF